jgi:hypothetical protein
LTSNTDRLYPSEAAVIFEGKESKAMADQLATVSKERLFRRAGILAQDDMHKVEQAIKIQLDIPQEQANRAAGGFSPPASWEERWGQVLQSHIWPDSELNLARYRAPVSMNFMEENAKAKGEGSRMTRSSRER